MPTVLPYKSNTSHTETMYSVKLKQLVVITAPELVKYKNDRYALRGKCPHSGFMCYKVISKARAKELAPDID